MCNPIKNIIFYAAITGSIFAYSTVTIAGGPLVIEGPDGNTPVTYKNPNITLHIENGKLGNRSNTEADALVQQAFDLWNSVNASTINLTKNESRLNFDINITNFEKYLPNIDETDFNADDGLNPVVYDDTGEIIDAFFGTGQSDFTIGFAASIHFVKSNNFAEGYAVINGKKLQLSDTTFKLLLAHEIGHFFGLDHSQVDINNKEGSGPYQFCNTSGRNEYPVMYPYACRNVSTLHADDISAVSALYPDEAKVKAQFGTLSGHLNDKFGNAISGANIWAKHNDGRTFSTVSDYLKLGTGFFELLLPSGNYTLYANSINTEFNGGSSIGPFALTPDEASFTCLDYIPATSYDSSASGNADVITITTNQTNTVDFRLSDVEYGECELLQKKSSSKTPSSNGTFATPSGLVFLLSVLLISRRFNRRIRS